MTPNSKKIFESLVKNHPGVFEELLLDEMREINDMPVLFETAEKTLRETYIREGRRQAIVELKDKIFRSI